jgi:hypothetical protein
MRFTIAIIFALLLVLFLPFNVHAQISEAIWLTTNNTSYKTGDTVVVVVNGSSVTPIQGFTFQIRYDPACLKPINAASPIPGMNGLLLPQNTGLVDASFASITPQMANGPLAQVQFEALGGCQTNLVMESAALAIRDASGFAAPLPGVKLEQTIIPLAIDSAPGNSTPQTLPGTPLPLAPTFESSSEGTRIPLWLIAIGVVLLITVLGIGINKLVQKL